MSPVRPGTDSAYGQAYAAGRQAVRRLLLDAASRLLEAEGPDALTVRRIAAAAGCSTTVLYTLFGGKAGVAEGLWREGFERLRQALEQAEGDDQRSDSNVSIQLSHGSLLSWLEGISGRARR